MAFWKQLIICILLLGGAGAAWVYFDESAVGTLESYGVSHPLIAELSAAGRGGDGTAEGAAGGKRPGAPGGGARGGFGGFGGPISVVAVPVTSATVNDRLTAIGDGQAIRSVAVKPTASGTIEDISIAAGGRVEAGETIVEIDSDEQRIAADRARLALESAERKLERYRSLGSSSAISTVEISNTELEVATARLALRQAELELSRRTIKAPIGGVVGIVDANIGDYVTTQTEFVTIHDRSEILVDFRVPERFASTIEPGTPVVATAIARPGERFEGKVSAVDNLIETDSRTMMVRARIPNANDHLRAGMSFSVAVRFEGENYPAIDPLAVQWDSEGSYVWRVANEKAEQVRVRIIQRNPESVLVEGDLSIGDDVVTEGLQRLRDGSDVRIINQRPQTGNAQGAKPLAAGPGAEGAKRPAGASPKPSKGT